MPPEQVVLLRNPAAGRTRRARRIHLDGIEHLDTPVPGHDDDAVLRRLRALDAATDVLGIAGGDGTLHYAVNALARARGMAAPWPRLSLLPTGSANDGARAVAALLGRPLPRTPEAWLARVRARLAAGDAGTPADLGRIAIEGAAPRLFANFVALGSPADWAALSAARWLQPVKRVSVGLAYGLCNLIVIARARRLAITQVIDGGVPRSGEVFAWFAANARWLGGGLDLGADVRLDSGQLAILEVPPAPRMHLIRLLRAVGRGQGPRPVPARAASVQLPAGAALNLDGEVFAPKTRDPVDVVVEVAPRGARWI